MRRWRSNPVTPTKQESVRTLVSWVGFVWAVAVLVISGLTVDACRLSMGAKCSLFRGNAALIMDGLGSLAEILRRYSPMLSVFSTTSPELIPIAE